MIAIDIVAATALILAISAVASPRMRKVIFAWGGFFVGKAEALSDDQLLEQERQNIKQVEADFNKQLGDYEGQAQELMDIVKEDDKEVERLTASVTVYARRPEAQETAERFAAQLEEAEKRRDEHYAQIEEHRKKYKLLTQMRDKSVAEINERINRVRRDMKDSRLEETSARLLETSTGLISSTGSSSATLQALEERTAQRKYSARGRAKVAMDLSKGNEADAEIEAELAHAKGASALDRFKARQTSLEAPKTEGFTVAQTEKVESH